LISIIAAALAKRSVLGNPGPGRLAKLIMETEVLIVGGGPTGLVLALWLARLGIRVRIIDRAPQSGMASRAFALQARTLEFYDQIGLARDAIARGRVIAGMNVHIGGRPVEQVAFGEFGRGLSPFPFVLVLLQGDHEKLLIDHLAAAGIQVERNTELIDLDDRGAVVRARLKGPDGADEFCEAAFVCGCDGVSSIVRELSKIGFPGESSEEAFYVADVEARGSIVDGELHYVMSGDDICSVFPLRGDGRVRLIGLVPEPVRKTLLQIGFDDVSWQVRRDTDLEVSVVESFSTYRVQQRIATEWRKGRVFLLGDASHVHSPAGGQGLNAGVGDAVNLAWKFGAVLRNSADVALLDTYQSERIMAARRIAATTDRGFALQARRGKLMGFARSALTRLAPKLMRMRLFRRWVFRTISQLAIDYRKSSGCAGKAGRVSGGDRLPWVRQTDQSDNFRSLRGIGWQAQVFGQVDDRLRNACAKWGLALHGFAWTTTARREGLAKDAVYLIRPDGYVAYASNNQDPLAIKQQLLRFKISFGAGQAEGRPAV
jgi:2-polyprenyl-6-methoxyphenol hydroxylase-like FAD-dependent oxidoreductase